VSSRPKVHEAVQDLAREAPVEVRVQGDCMKPFFADGDRVLVSAARMYWPGDVLVFRAPDGRLLAHRLLGYRPWKGSLALVTRGDSCVVHDSPVPRTAVLGRIDSVRPSSGDRAAAILGFLGLAVRRCRRWWG
jgi:signal peptidase I